MDQIDLILDKTNGGLKVFQEYLGKTIAPGVKFKNPFYDDTKASCNLYYGKKCNRYFLVDFGDSTLRGDCFWFVARWENLDAKNDFDEILRLIDRKLCLNIFDDKKSIQTSNNTKPVVVLANSHQNVPSKELPFEIETNASLSQLDVQYWGQYGIDIRTLAKYSVRSVKAFHSRRSDGVPYSIYEDGHPFFGYFFNEGKGVKIYRPGQQMRFVYAGHLPHPYIFGLNQLPQSGNVLYITGGEKDVLSLSSHRFHTIFLNSETAKVPEDLLPSLQERFEHIAILYDMDDTGRKESANRVNELIECGCSSVLNVELPLCGSKQEKDISDFFRLGHTADELSFLTEEKIASSYHSRLKA